MLFWVALSLSPRRLRLGDFSGFLWGGSWADHLCLPHRSKVGGFTRGSCGLMSTSGKQLYRDLEGLSKGEKKLSKYDGSPWRVTTHAEYLIIYGAKKKKMPINTPPSQLFIALIVLNYTRAVGHALQLSPLNKNRYENRFYTLRGPVVFQVTLGTRGHKAWAD